MASKSAATTAAPKTASLKKEFLIFISIPVGIILLLVAVLVLPSLFARPQYDFLYSYCSSYDCNGSILVDNNGHAEQTGAGATTTNSYYSRSSPEIYYHDTRNNSSRRIELVEAISYKLDPSTKSPDGYSFTQGGSSDSGFLFWGYSSDYSWYLKKSSLIKSKPLNLGVSGYDSQNVKLVGWVQK